MVPRMRRWLLRCVRCVHEGESREPAVAPKREGWEVILLLSILLR